VFGDGRRRLGVLSDAGCATPHMRAMLSGCDGLMLEFNHDPQMLAAGPYPGKLKRRVGGTLGHLSNAQAAGLLAALDCTRLQHLVLTHLSEVNNTPEHARAAAAAALRCAPDWIACAHQERGLPWRELG
jgi:phosphoribosyl 1,2-cyclic phosphodiesterase